jgi:hypothetical protein
MTPCDPALATPGRETNGWYVLTFIHLAKIAKISSRPFDAFAPTDSLCVEFSSE